VSQGYVRPPEISSAYPLVSMCLLFSPFFSPGDVRNVDLFWTRGTLSLSLMTLTDFFARAPPRTPLVVFPLRSVAAPRRCAGLKMRYMTLFWK